MQRKHRTVNASCLALYKARSVTCTQTELPGGAGFGKSGWPPPHRRHPPGNSGPVTGNSSLCFLEVLPPTTLSLKKKKQIRFILLLKEAVKRLCFLLAERREKFVNSLTSSSQTTAQTCGAMGDDRGVQDVPGFPRLTPLASPLQASRVPPPPSPPDPF